MPSWISAGYVNVIDNAKSLTVDVNMYYSSQYYKDESTRESERAAAEKQCVLAIKKEADKRGEEISSLKVMQLLLSIDLMG